MSNSNILNMQPAHSSEKTARLLVVEDESVVAMDIVESLEEMGYEVLDPVDNGKDALKAVELHRPDLILMDVVIKGEMDGITTVQHIAHRFGTPSVFLTAFSDSATVERAAKTAPYGYVTKPFKSNELRAVIEVALYKSRLERQLRESDQWFASTLRCVGDCVVATDPHGKIRFMNPIAEKVLGWSAENALGRKIEEVLPLHDSGTGQSIESPVYRALQENKVVGIEFGTHITTRDGRIVPIDDSVAPIRDDYDHKLLGAVIAFRDVSDRVGWERSLRQSEGRFRSAFDFAPVGMALIGLSGNFLQANAALLKLLGQEKDRLLELNQLQLTHADDVGHEVDRMRGLRAGMSPTTQFEKRFRHANGHYIWCLVSISLLSNAEDSLCYLYQIHDLTERKEAELRLAQLAHYDPLTGLANRARLMEEIDLMLRLAKRGNSKVAVLFMDVDHFKRVNDSLGHELGDSLLVQVAARLKACVRDSDCVARLGGDEFVIVLHAVTSAIDAMVVIDKLEKKFSTPIRIGEHDVTVGLSIGVSIYPDDGDECRSLLRCSDSALYHAKAVGRGNSQFYRPEMTLQAEKRMTLDIELRAAIAHGQFELYYQPYIALNDEKLVGAEALIRWRHPERGMVPPDLFIPHAEESGLIVQIDEWVLRTACREAVAWEEAHGVPIRVAVNVSARKFQSADFFDHVVSALRDAGLPADRLCVEITEQVLLLDTQEVSRTLEALKGIGVKIAIDDFGIGYSSLSYIKRFSPHKLKIDRSFIDQLPNNAENAAIVRAVLAMSESLGIEVVAEGVETLEQKQFLTAEGCDFAQGYLISRPCESSRFLGWLKDYGAGNKVELIS